MILAAIIVAIIAIIAVAVFFYLFFNRDPVRTIPPEKSVVSPSDGRIIEIIDLLELKKRKPNVEIRKGMFGKIRTMAKEISDHCYVVCIKLSIFDAHMQRAPLAGTVLSVNHQKGKFLKADCLKATIENEKVETLIKNKSVGKIKVIQVAGFLTRRIESLVKKGEKLIKGQRIGRIMLGSMVVLIIPDLHLKIKKGGKVRAGETVIAVYE